MTGSPPQFAASYVLPLRTSADATSDELTRYVGWLGQRVDLVVVDGSEPAIADNRAKQWAQLPLRHERPAPDLRMLNGKVANVVTGLRLARAERVIIADDDVRYDDAALDRVVRLLDHADLVRPQNYFDPCPWHAAWDTGRTLLNRMAGGDYPGTLAVRREALPDGYDGDVLFENLELIRTVAARGGRVVTPLDCYVRRLPPTPRHFWSQRRRQAYDDFAQPARLARALLTIPTVAALVAGRRWRALFGAATTAVTLAEAGRSRAGGREIFPATAALFAPLWLLERGICSWLAVYDRFARGGVHYHGVVIRRAASSRRELARVSCTALTARENSDRDGVRTSV